MKYDPSLFCQILDDLPQIKFLREEIRPSTLVRVYENVKGEPVFIELDDNLFSDGLAKIYLQQLGLSDKIPALYPPEQKQNIEPLVDTVMSEGDCNVCNGTGQIKIDGELNQCVLCEGTGSPKLLTNPH